MRRFDWDPDKNLKLQAERNVSVEDVVTAIAAGFTRNIFSQNKRFWTMTRKLHEFDYSLDDEEQALRDGLPYQTLISSVLHKYIEGKS